MNTDEHGWRRGRAALRTGETGCRGGAPLSPFVPHGEREKEVLFVTPVPARTSAKIEIYLGILFLAWRGSRPLFAP